MRSRSAVPACPALPREVLARHWVWPEELYETTDRGPGVGDRHMRLWLHLADRRVLALRFAALDAPDDRVIAPTVAALAGDLRGERQGLELPDVGYVHVLYAAPVAPPPTMNAATGRSEGPLRWAPGLDGEVLDALQSLRGRRFYLSVRNYNRLAPLPPELRARRLQALRRFPALVAPILLTAHAYPNCADGQRHARRHADPEVEAAIDRGRDLTGALARHYGISRALVRSALNAEFWDISYGMRRMHPGLARCASRQQAPGKRLGARPRTGWPAQLSALHRQRRGERAVTVTACGGGSSAQLRPRLGGYLVQAATALLAALSAACRCE
ncbi:hypothetical protein [Tepidimonas charontis]|uniref:hypothetical protein n=1 Tax=Tepidimonas charontis TaxID=2267262 RepID=UPI001F305DCF|nr:hypothetical protein [Tepidimonas charontis]